MHKFLNLKTICYTIIFVTLLVIAAIINFNNYMRHKHNGIVFKGAYMKDYVAVFSEIYNTDYWRGGSGVGSNPQNAAQYISLLQQYFDDSRFNTIVDLGCGDWQIMRMITIPANKTYHGVDVVPSVIAADTAEFTQKNLHFYHVIGLKDFMAQNITGDLIIVKDVLQHWPNSEIEYFLAKVLPRFKYALITNYYNHGDKLHNKGLLMGPSHSVGLLEAPFNLQHARSVLEYEGPDPKQVVFYERAPAALTNY